jgi:hypothetical protein
MLPQYEQLLAVACWCMKALSAASFTHLPQANFSLALHHPPSSAVGRICRLWYIKDIDPNPHRSDLLDEGLNNTWFCLKSVAVTMRYILFLVSAALSFMFIFEVRPLARTT